MAALDFRIVSLQLMWLLTHKRDFLVEYSDRIKPEYFFNDAAQVLVRWSLDHFEANNEVISESAIEQLLEYNEDELDSQGITDKAIWSLYDNLTPVRNTESKYVGAQAKLFCEYQGLHIALSAASKTLKDDGPDAAWNVLDRARGITRIAESRNVSLLGDYSTALKRIGERETALDHISTGLPKLDGFMDGGLRTGEVAVFLAPTGRGKTMWLCHLAAMGLSHGVEVIYDTLEVDRDEIWLRTMSTITGSNINDLRNFAAASEGDPDYAGLRKRPDSPIAKIEALRTRLKRTGNASLDVFIHDIAVRGATLDTIFADLEKTKQSGADPKLLIIDYADRLQAKGRHERGYEGQEEIYKELQLAAKEFDVAIWTATQANRSGLNKAKLSLVEIQGAFSKAFEATYVIAAGQTYQMERRHEFNLVIAKARRSGSAGKQFAVQYDFAKNSWRSAAQKLSKDDDFLNDDYGQAKSFHQDEDDDEMADRMEREEEDKKQRRK